MRTRHHLRYSIIGCALLLVALATAGTPAFSSPPRVYPGVDVLLTYYRDVLSGKRVGVISHRAATGVGGWPTATLLSLDPRIRVVALFAPEHGFNGTLPAGAFVPSAGGQVPMYSLYPSTLKPSPEMLAGVDALVFDLQDVGTRAYTYVSTMALAMQAAAEQGKLFVVLDRPNPLGGDRVDGPVLDPAFASFIGLYPIPSVHGMTIGELAMMFNQEFGIGANLVVIPMSGWHASMRWEDTGLPWLSPSPAISSPAAAELHAVTGMFEGTNLAVGAGTSVPFQTVTARWLQGDLLAERLTARHLPGVRFEVVSAGPPDRRLSGIRVVVTDARQFKPATTAVHILDAIRQLHPDGLQFAVPPAGSRYRFDLVWGTDAVRKAIQRGESADRIVASWTEDVQRFLEIRQRYLIYPRSIPAQTAARNP